MRFRTRVEENRSQADKNIAYWIDKYRKAETPEQQLHINHNCYHMLEHNVLDPKERAGYVIYYKQMTMQEELMNINSIELLKI